MNKASSKHSPLPFRDTLSPVSQASSIDVQQHRVAERKPVESESRTAVVDFVGWSLSSWGVSHNESVAVIEANKVVAASHSAQAAGVEVGQIKRIARSKCPGLDLIDRDYRREARLFEHVAKTLNDLIAKFEIIEPGLVCFKTRGPARYFGGEEALSEKIFQKISEKFSELPLFKDGNEVRLGIADSFFAAHVACQQDPTTIEQVATSDSQNLLWGKVHRSLGTHKNMEASALIVEPNLTRQFLSSQSVNHLDYIIGDGELTDVYCRLGLKTLGQVAALKASDMLGRFGNEGLLSHQLASGDEQFREMVKASRTEATKEGPSNENLNIEKLIEPPATKNDICLVAAKESADLLFEKLRHKGSVCTRLKITLESEDGETHERAWRSARGFKPNQIVERVSWQLEGWVQNYGHPKETLTASEYQPNSGVSRIKFAVNETTSDPYSQTDLFGKADNKIEDVNNVVARLQSMLGSDAVKVPECKGGLGPKDRLKLVSAAAIDLGEKRSNVEPCWVGEPWPGQVPSPLPARVCLKPVAVELLDIDGCKIGVSGRGVMEAVPYKLVMDTQSFQVLSWSAPWPAEQRWWDPFTKTRRARLQVVLEDNSAHLLMLEDGNWHVEATYD